MGLRDARAASYEGSRPELRALVPQDASARVLDVGCASGAVGAALVAEGRAGCVVGVERDPVLAADARSRLHRVVEDDLEVLDLAPLGTFDVVVAGDVLEHLVDPWAVLRRAVAQLRAGGSVVVSLPNVRHWEALWQLGVKGTWPRRTQGIFDATHLRWFTLADAYDLLAQAGAPVVEVRRVHRLSPVGPPRRGGLVDRLPGRGFATFQHLLRGVRP